MNMYWQYLELFVLVVLNPLDSLPNAIYFSVDSFNTLKFIAVKYVLVLLKTDETIKNGNSRLSKIQKFPEK